MNPDTTVRTWEELALPEQPPAPRRRRGAGAAQDRLWASYLTHELRAPLTSVLSSLSLLRERAGERLSVEESHLLSLALRNANRLEALVRDILDYARLDAGKLPLNREPVPPREIAREAMESLKAWAVAKGVRLVRRAEPEPLPRVWADRRRSAQVLINLLSNALKFTPRGGRVEVSAAPGRLEHEGTVVFSVKDNGCGIPPEELERVFQAFERSASGERNASGSGLGLSLSKAFVEAQGGRIWAESWKGLGSTFRFTLPIAEQDMARPVQAYPQPVEYHGLLVGLLRRFNGFLAFLLP